MISRISRIGVAALATGGYYWRGKWVIVMDDGVSGSQGQRIRQFVGTGAQGCLYLSAAKLPRGRGWLSCPERTPSMRSMVRRVNLHAR